MSEAGLPRLVFERWTDPVAGDILETAEIDVIRLDLAGSAEQGWAALESAHGYQVATRTDVASLANGTQWLAGASLVNRCEQLLAVCSAGAGYDVIDVDACTRAGIAVCNNSGPGAEAVAEHALGFMLVNGTDLYLVSDELPAYPAHEQRTCHVFHTEDYMKALFPNARVLPPVNNEMQHCCIIRK